MRSESATQVLMVRSPNTGVNRATGQVLQSKISAQNRRQATFPERKRCQEPFRGAWRAVSVFTVHPVVFLHRVYFLAVELSALKP
jgi:hypothetical protein